MHFGEDSDGLLAGFRPGFACPFTPKLMQLVMVGKALTSCLEIPYRRLVPFALSRYPRHGTVNWHGQWLGLQCFPPQRQG
jgi:hypothetical protein